MKKYALSLLILSPLVLSAQLNDTLKVRLDKYTFGLVKAGEPGGAIGVVYQGQTVYENYFGLASLQHSVPVTDSSRFNIASVAKQFTALCVLQLTLDRKLSLEEDIRKYLPDFYPAIQKPILIRHLLNHTSGIRDFYDLLSIQQDPWWKKEGLSNKKALELLKKQRTLNFSPGNDYLYSNSNYTLLTQIIAEASGMSFHEYTKKLFERLDMPNTYFQKSYMHVIPNQALPYADWGNGKWQQYPMLTNLYGDGFLFTTLRDQLNFESVIQEAKEQSLILSQQPIANAEISKYGYGLELEDRLGYRAVCHSGATGAYHAQTVRYPEEELSIVVMSNNGRLWSGTIADDIARFFLPAKGNLGEREITGFERKIVLDELEGLYKSENGRLINIYPSGGTLYWQNANNNPFELINVYGSMFGVGSARVGFTDTSMTLFRKDGEKERFEKLPAFSPTQNDLHEVIGTYLNEETDVRFIVTLDSGQLRIRRADGKDSAPLNILFRDNYLFGDYQLRIDRDTTDHVEAVLLTFSRLKEVRFERLNPGPSDKLKYTKDEGYIQIGKTTEKVGAGKGDILLTKNDSLGNEEWFRLIGGKSYDVPSQIQIAKGGGYYILGSTSSMGNGNYDAWLIKTDEKGKVEWEKTFGDASNNYGYSMKEQDDGSILVKVTDRIPSEAYEQVEYYRYDPQ